MARNKEVKCAACGLTARISGNTPFNRAHAHCSMAGRDATGTGFLPCPTHGRLVWVVGPYSTYRGCTESTCVAGTPSAKYPGGRRWRYTAGRGDASSTATADGTAYVPPAGTPAPSPSPSPSVERTPDPVTTVPTVKASDINLGQFGAFGDAIAAFVEARASTLASEMIADAISKLDSSARVVEWKVNDRPFAVVDGTHHKMLPRLLKLYAAGFRNFLVVGPAGSGKTTLAHDLQRAIEAGKREADPSAVVPWGVVSCTSGMSETALTGRAIPNLATGETVYQGTEFVLCYEGGGVFLLDEVDAADPNVMLVINTALANGHMPLANRTSAPSATRHVDSVIICAANTWGTGADRQYVGRNQLDAAFLDRFVGTTIEVDYDRDLESRIVGDAHICARVWQVRDKARELKLRRIVGTRFLMSVTRLVKSAGETLDAALAACCAPWTDDERSRVGVK